MRADFPKANGRPLLSEELGTLLYGIVVCYLLFFRHIQLLLYVVLVCLLLVSGMYVCLLNFLHLLFVAAAAAAGAVVVQQTNK